MAKVHDNPITEGLSGKLGKRLVFRKGRGGRTIVALSPVPTEGRTFNAEQLAHQEAFKQATQYAVGAKDNPIYVNLARGAEATSYNLAVADWFGQPKVLEIDINNWTGEIGQTIRVKATDDTKVVSVQMSIQSPDGGTTYEQGQAVPSGTDGLWWVYTTTSQVTIQPGTRVVATAKDLPGNAEGMVWQMN